MGGRESYKFCKLSFSLSLSHAPAFLPSCKYDVFFSELQLVNTDSNEKNVIALAGIIRACLHMKAALFFCSHLS